MKSRIKGFSRFQDAEGDMNEPGRGRIAPLFDAKSQQKPWQVEWIVLRNALK